MIPMGGIVLLDRQLRWTAPTMSSSATGVFLSALEFLLVGIFRRSMTRHCLFRARSYCCRSAAYLHKKDVDHALADAEECIRLNPDWPKGYVRKGAALHTMNKLDDAIATYEEGVLVALLPRFILTIAVTNTSPFHSIAV